ncbi:Uncharacterised protein [Mycoplasmoides gallisepticum]|uniref:Uncharacterized protein n=1 Tax=Mycoplasmoides gallisepticum TaxID=2096 RepID=A0A3B0PDM2_MYCGL|nr:Uncharacterised protein [Mycoplasmoides gallisepticum]
MKAFVFEEEEEEEEEVLRSLGVLDWPSEPK